MNHLVVAGIHTGIGKTVCSAVLAEALHFDYWKPVQAGDLQQSDSLFVSNHISNPITKVHPEAYGLKLAASPHWAAAQEGITINLAALNLPAATNNLIIETAGGVLSPLGASLLNIDMLKHFQLPVILVSNNYLGSINHTLLTVQALQQAGLPICGLVFSGEDVPSTREFILNYTGLPLLFSIPLFPHINRNVIHDFASSISTKFKNKLNGPDGER